MPELYPSRPKNPALFEEVRKQYSRMIFDHTISEKALTAPHVAAHRKAVATAVVKGTGWSEPLALLMEAICPMGASNKVSEERVMK